MTDYSTTSERLNFNNTVQAMYGVATEWEQHRILYGVATEWEQHRILYGVATEWERYCIMRSAVIINKQ